METVMETANPASIDRPILKARYALAKASADELTEHYEFPPIPVTEIAGQCGVQVLAHGFDRYSESMAGFCNFRRQSIYVNATDNIRRQYFTIAHELGHWVLHREYFLKEPEKYQVLPRMQNPNKGDVFEQEANCFAANLLVPSRLLNPVRGSHLVLLCEMFMVSESMMTHRLKNA